LDNSAETFQAKFRKKVENKFAKNYFSSKFASGDLEYSSANRTEILPVKFRFFSRNWPNFVV